MESSYPEESHPQVRSPDAPEVDQKPWRPNPGYVHEGHPIPALIPGSEEKKKRGRPRKNPLPEASPSSPDNITAGPLPDGTIPQKRPRGRPKGSTTKNRGKSSAGHGFVPHILMVAAGEDVATKIFSFSQQEKGAVCVMSANGACSSVTLRQPATSGGTVTYEGRFEILSLSGSFMPNYSEDSFMPAVNDERSRSRTGGLSVSLAGPDGRVVGGGVAGLLIAASPVQVVAGSFSIPPEPKAGQSPVLPNAAAPLPPAPSTEPTGIFQPVVGSGSSAQGGPELGFSSLLLSQGGGAFQVAGVRPGMTVPMQNTGQLEAVVLPNHPPAAGVGWSLEQPNHNNFTSAVEEANKGKG